MALQTHHNQSVRHRRGLLFTRLDRSGDGTITSRLGLSAPAINVGEDTSILQHVKEATAEGEGLHYVVCDEVQFFSPEQIEELAELADCWGIDVFAFGISTDFRRQLFPGSQRIIELADHVVSPSVPALCWCGNTATHQARLVNGIMVMRGETVVVGDVEEAQSEVTYVVLCRRHHRGQEPYPPIPEDP